MPAPGQGPKPRPSPPASATSTPLTARRATPLNVRITRLLDRAARMGHGADARRADLLGVFPQITGGVVFRARLPCARALIKLALRQLDVERPFVAIDLDDVAAAD